LIRSSDSFSCDATINSKDQATLLASVRSGAGGLFLSDSSWILLTKIVEQRRCDNAAALKLLDATADKMNDSHFTLHHQAHSHTTLLLNVTNDDEAANITTVGVLVLHHSTGFFVMLFSFPDCSSSIITTAAS
jgi:hypothetical protein